MEKYLDKIIPVLLSIATGTIANLITDSLKDIVAKKKKKVKKKKTSKKKKDDS